LIYFKIIVLKRKLNTKKFICSSRKFWHTRIRHKMFCTSPTNQGRATCKRKASAHSTLCKFHLNRARDKERSEQFHINSIASFRSLQPGDTVQLHWYRSDYGFARLGTLLEDTTFAAHLIKTERKTLHEKSNPVTHYWHIQPASEPTAALPCIVRPNGQVTLLAETLQRLALEQHPVSSVTWSAWDGVPLERWSSCD
jgi:hypothetical protein